MDATPFDKESVVGDECHIISKSSCSRSIRIESGLDLDDYENLLLLCQTHHKLVDDQSNYYTVNTLQRMKQRHELWVEAILEHHKESSVVSIPSHDEIDEQTEIIDEIEDSNADDITKFSLIFYEHARRKWTSLTLTPSFVNTCK